MRGDMFGQRRRRPQINGPLITGQTGVHPTSKRAPVSEMKPMPEMKEVAETEGFEPSIPVVGMVP